MSRRIADQKATDDVPGAPGQRAVAKQQAIPNKSGGELNLSGAGLGKRRSMYSLSQCSIMSNWNRFFIDLQP